MTQPDILPDQPSEIHFEIPKKAALFLGRLVDGNRLTAAQVRLARHETVVHTLTGRITASILPDITHHDLKGKVPQGTAAATKAEVISMATAHGVELLADEQAQAVLLGTLQKQPGQGFAMEAMKFSLPMLKKSDYSVVDRCGYCHGAGQMSCQGCHATGQKSCGNCSGHGAVQCNSCGSSGTIQRADGSRLPCNRCHGSGRAQCPQCQGRKSEPCPDCHASGKAACEPCGRSGYITHVYHAAWHAEAGFYMENVPPEAVKAVEHFGVMDLARNGHAEIFLASPVLNDGKLVFPCNAFLPVAQAEFSIEGKTAPALIAGLHGSILQIDPVLDAIIKPGLVALSKLSKGATASTALLEQACKYKIVREALAGLSHHGKRPVYQKLKKSYPVALSDKYARMTVKYADLALLALGDGPRKKGLIVGAVLSAGIYGGYFMTTFRGSVMGFMADRGLMQHMFLADAAIYGLGFLAAFYTIKFMAAGSLDKILPANVRVKKSLGLPAAGKQGLWALGVCLAIWLAAAFMAVPQPGWMPKAAVSQPASN